MNDNYFKNNSEYLISLLITVLFSTNLFAQANLIVDSSFEETSSVWVLSTGTIRVTTSAQNGSYAIKSTDNNGATQTISGLTPWTTYQLRCYLKSSNNSPVLLGVKKYGGNELTVQKNTTTYSEATLKFTTGPVSTSAIIYCQNPSGGSNEMFADNFSLIQIDENPYSLVWSDEFNGSGGVDKNNWTHEIGFIRSNQPQFYQEENAIQKEGNLIIEAKKESLQNTRLNPYYIGGTRWPGNALYINYTSASINTRNKHSWLYGRFEIRAKIANLPGARPAIWTLGETCAWPSNGEVDIMENYSGAVRGNFAWGTNTQWSAKWDGGNLPISEFLKTDPDWLSKFHIWTLDWDANKMSIYIDGMFINDVDLNLTINGTAACSGENPFRKKQFLLLNMSLPGNSPEDVLNTTFPTQYSIDYVRVYQLSSSLGVNKNEKQNNPKVYPNPVKNVLSIVHPTVNPKFRIYDISGKVLMSGNESKVDVSKLIPGVYFIQVEDLEALKFMKE